LESMSGWERLIWVGCGQQGILYRWIGENQGWMTNNEPIKNTFMLNPFTK